MGEKRVPVALEFRPELLVVVDAPVEDQRQPELAVNHRLGAGIGEVDDLESSMPESHSAGCPHAGAIRSAPPHGAGHLHDHAHVCGLAVPAVLARDAAHVAFSPPVR